MAIPKGWVKTPEYEDEDTVDHKSVFVRTEKRWWLNWEVYLIVGIAAIFRLLFIDTTQFMADHAIFYHMAYDGVAHHILPISGNRASAGPLIPPLFVYFMMIPAAVTSNPVGGAIFIALCNVAGVLITYLFTRRYYGRLAGTIAALLYATAINVIIFNRDIWQPDLLPPLAILFMWCLFRGVVEQRRNWFFPAVLLFAGMCQLHTTAIYLALPLGIAFLLAFRTIRIREIFLICGSLLVLFSPYIVLEKIHRFADITQYIALTKIPAFFSTQALQLYLLFVRSTVSKPWGVNNGQIVDTHLFPANAHSIMLTTPLHYLQIFLKLENVLMLCLLICAILTAVFLLLWPGEQPHTRKGLMVWWRGFLASSERKGLLLLLAWQGLVIVMMRTSLELFIHYLLFLLPGPFILLAIFFSLIPKLVRHFNPSWGKLARYSVVIGCGLIVFAQIIGSTSTLIDRAQGNFDSNSVYPEYFDLATLQNILSAADQLAQKKHIGRIYMATDFATDTSIQYLSQLEKTPIETFDAWHCMVLPGVESGPVVFVALPNNAQVETILHGYAQATLTETVAHPGGAPFRLYILTANPEPAPVMQLTGGWQSLSAKAQLLASSTTNDEWLMTRWRIPTTQGPASRRTYNYKLNVQMSGAITQLNCPLTATSTGDQIFALQGVNKGASLPSTMSIQLSYVVIGPQVYQERLVSVDTFDNMTLSTTQILLANGEKQIVMDIPLSR